jgi:hypothetical protein
MSAETPSLSDLAQAALAVVGKRGGPGVHAAVLDGIQFAITLDGPDLPDAIPEKFAPPKMVRESMDWTGTYTLKVAAPPDGLQPGKLGECAHPPRRFLTQRSLILTPGFAFKRHGGVRIGLHPLARSRLPERSQPISAMRQWSMDPAGNQAPVGSSRRCSPPAGRRACAGATPRRGRRRGPPH